MVEKVPFVTLVLLLSLGVLSGCGGLTRVEPMPNDELPVVVPREAQIVSEGSLEPARWIQLRVPSTGRITDVLVSVGDQVEQGALLIRCDPLDAELALQEAEAALALARASLAEVEGQPLPEMIAVTEAQLEAARATIAQAAARRDRVAQGEVAVDIANAEASLAAALLELKQAYNLHEKTMECLAIELPDSSEETICPALGPPEEAARRQWHIAQDRYDAARLGLNAEESAAQPRLQEVQASVSSASARAQALEARLQLQQEGSLPQQIAAAAADVAEAEASVAAARFALESTAIRAPFGGTVVEVRARVGDTAAPDRVLLVLATLDNLQVRTIDLSELDTVRIAVGQPVVVVFDAFPNAPLPGHILRIGEQAEDYRGDVTYPVIVALDESRPGLRWGMSALVEIDIE